VGVAEVVVELVAGALVFEELLDGLDALAPTFFFLICCMVFLGMTKLSQKLVGFK